MLQTCSKPSVEVLTDLKNDMNSTELETVNDESAQRSWRRRYSNI